MDETLALPRDMLQALDADRVRYYLLAAGWIEDIDPPYQQAFSLYTEKGPGAEVILPRNNTFADFAGLMSELIKAFAIVEKRRVWDVLNELLSPEGDIVRFRLISPYASKGLIPLTAGVRLLNNGKESLVAAACSAHQKQPAYYTKSYKEVTDFIDTCILGQTEVGSFVLPITVPIPTNQQYDMLKLPLFPGTDQELGLEFEPFARRVSVTFMKGLAALEEASKTRNYDRFLEDLPDGVSANLCEALSEMRPPGLNSDVNIEIVWSGGRPRRPPGVTNQIHIENHYFDVIQKVGQKLRGKSTELDVRIDGYVRELSDKRIFTRGNRGVVFVERTDADRGTLIKIVLRDKQYELACDAHKSHVKVTARGKLFRDAKMQTAVLKNLISFKLAE